MTNPFDPENENDGLPEVPSPHATSDELVIIKNTETGEWIVVRKHIGHDYNPETGAPRAKALYFPIQCQYGDLIHHPKDLSFCSASGLPVCRCHSILCLCGRIFAVRYTHLYVDEFGRIMRLCPSCYNSLTRGPISRLVHRVSRMICFWRR